jgi:hypothetical protein
MQSKQAMKNFLMITDIVDFYSSKINYSDNFKTASSLSKTKLILVFVSSFVIPATPNDRKIKIPHHAGICGSYWSRTSDPPDS